MTFDPFAPKTEQADPFQPADENHPVVQAYEKSKEKNVSAGSEGKVVVTFKQHGGFDAPWVVVHADDAADAKRQLGEVLKEELLNTVAITAQAFYDTKEGNQAPPAPPQRSNYRQNNSRPQGGSNQAQGDFGPVQTCHHGEKRVIEGKYGPFWACPADKDDPSKCKAQKAYKN